MSEVARRSRASPRSTTPARPAAVTVLDGASLTLAAGEVVGAGGAVGGGQVDAPAHRRAARRAERAATVRLLGQATARPRRRARARGCGATRSASSTSSTTCCRSSRRSRTWRCRSGRPAPGAAAAEARARELLGAVGLGAPARPPAGGALGRRAAAGGARARARQPRRGCCSPTSRPATSTPRPRAGSSTCCSSWCASTGLAALIATHNPELAGAHGPGAAARRRADRRGHAPGLTAASGAGRDPPGRLLCDFVESGYASRYG